MKNFKVIGAMALVIAIVCTLVTCTLDAQNYEPSLKEREQMFIEQCIEEDWGSGYYGVVDESYVDDKYFAFWIYSEDSDCPAGHYSGLRSYCNLENS